jgi:two-component system, NarL family, invasion response regulator UvrY
MTPVMFRRYNNSWGGRIRGLDMKILLVDDHAVVRAGVRRLLTSEHVFRFWRQIRFKGPLNIYRRERPDLVVLDLNLTCLSGWN